MKAAIRDTNPCALSSSNVLLSNLSVGTAPRGLHLRPSTRPGGGARRPRRQRFLTYFEMRHHCLKGPSSKLEAEAVDVELFYRT